MNLDRIAPALDLALPPCLAGSAPDGMSYGFETIDYPGDGFTRLLGINNSAIIAGYHGATTNKGFTYDLSTKMFTNENFPGSAQTQVIGINNLGRTSGSYVTTSGRTLGFTAKAGVYTLVTPHGTPFNRLLSQNDFAQAAGYYSTTADGSGPDHAYIYDEGGGVFETFTFPDSVSARATGINSLGDVCGFSIDGSNKMHGWLQVWGRVTLLDFPGATATQPLGLNNKGQVVGSYTDSSNNKHGFVYVVGTKKWQSIDDPSGAETVVNGINDNGVLVGFYGTLPTNSGFVATPR